MGTRAGLLQPAYAGCVDGTQVVLYVLGGALELVGIVLVASPDVFPLVAAARRGGRSLRAYMGSRVAVSVRRIFRQPGKVHTPFIPSQTQVFEPTLEGVNS